MIISFAWTTQAFLAQRKFCTRRNWSLPYAGKFHQFDQIDAWDKLPRAHGKKVGRILLTESPFRQWTSLMTAEDYEIEGLAWMEIQGLLIRGMQPLEFFENWKKANELVWVIRFDPIFPAVSEINRLNSQLALPL